MFENLKYRIAKYLALRKVKKNIEPEREFNSFFSKAKNVLLILPSSQEDVDNSIEVFHFLKSKNKEVKLLRLTPVKISDYNAIEIINFMEADRNKLNLPNKAFLEKLKSAEFEIVVDLDRNNNFVSGYITKMSNANFKIGFMKENSDLFYNFQVSNSAINSEISYKNLLNSLLMF